MAAVRRGATATNDNGQRLLATATTFAELLTLAMGDQPQWKIAEEIGVSQSRVSRWLSGGLPDSTKLGLVATWLGVPDTDLFVFLRDRHPRRRTTHRTQAERITAMENALSNMAAQIDELRALLEDVGKLGPPPDGNL